MSPKEKLIDTLDAIEKHDSSSEELFNTLETILNLMNELSSNRLLSAEYRKRFTHGRLNIDIHYQKGK